MSVFIPNEYKDEYENIKNKNINSKLILKHFE